MNNTNVFTSPRMNKNTVAKTNELDSPFKKSPTIFNIAFKTLLSFRKSLKKISFKSLIKVSTNKTLFNTDT